MCDQGNKQWSLTRSANTYIADHYCRHRPFLCFCRESLTPSRSKLCKKPMQGPKRIEPLRFVVPGSFNKCHSVLSKGSRVAILKPTNPARPIASIAETTA